MGSPYKSVCWIGLRCCGQGESRAYCDTHLWTSFGKIYSTDRHGTEIDESLLSRTKSSRTSSSTSHLFPFPSRHLHSLAFFLLLLLLVLEPDSVDEQKKELLTDDFSQSWNYFIEFGSRHRARHDSDLNRTSYRELGSCCHISLIRSSVKDRCRMDFWWGLT